MSLQLSPKAPTRTVTAILDEARGPLRPARGREVPCESPSHFGLACQDIMDEVRQRMASRGYTWE